MSHSENVSETSPDRVDVVVVGAGYAGLSAALALVDAGVNAVVLEGADRVGGRTLSEVRPTGVTVDHGGQWVGPTQTRLLGLAERFGVPTFPTYWAGDHLEIWADSSINRYRGTGPDEGDGLHEYEAHIEVLDALAATIDLHDPSGSPDAAALDDETVASYLVRTVPSEGARRRFALAVEGVWACEPAHLSMLHFLFYIAAAGSFDELMETDGCAQDSRFVGGAQAPALAVAAHLGDRVRLGWRADRVVVTDDGVLVETPVGTVRADRAILTLPPQAAGAVRFDPPLPPAKARFVDRSVMGDVAKVHVTYSTPFWRGEGLSGQATVYDERETGVVFDNSPDDASRGVLVAFVYGRRVDPWARLEADERRAAIMTTLVDLFGERAADPVDYVEKIWSTDPWIRGAYAANPTPGAWSAYGEQGWRIPTGRLHWAGSETSSVWNGYIDGAIASGRRAAQEILDLR
ncbi:putative flavin-containing monoamine oxidase AofH [Gordonia spumicola]|uniref:Putative flavin-containing monoamine oxidase AofH n=1 Tax=Gordonia spumicola TaxID=589161 RepID=A0A7I9V7N1_9ACTN|nr:FAD-dependent oxidoreductase [Gordonia spumicola]GEE01317.1 putative flavin-containing monoamine oxidase AofH [Gordonia spumicola]